MLFNRWLMTVMVALGLVACGGGGGNARAPASGTPGTTPVTVGSLTFTLDKSSITNGGGDQALLTVTALDATRNVVKGLPMTVSLDSGAYSPLVNTTNDFGQASGYISIGGNKANRTITATFSIGGQVGTASVAVTGSSISITALPSIITPGTTITLSVKALDSNGAVIPSVDIQLGGSLGFNQLVNTGLSGIGSATVSAPAASITPYSITASGSGVTQTNSILVVSSGLPAIPDAIGPISSATLTITPNSISRNTAGSSTYRASLQAKFQDASNNPIANVRARFEIVAGLVGSGEYISTGTNIVYSGVDGIATADYVPGTRSSPTDGVVIRVCYGITDASMNLNPCTFVTSKLTVTGQPLSISIGDNNKLATGSGGLTYIKQFVVGVTDAAGRAVSGAQISASVDITQYGKGVYSNAYLIPLNVTSPPDINADQYLSLTTAPNNGSGGNRIWCPNEDTNRNGFLDSLPTPEDTNGDGMLTPRKADIILSFVSSNQTNSTGTLLLQVEYAQSVASWLAYTIKASTSVLGSEGTVSKAYVTDHLKEDETNGAFLTPPYGSGACNTAQ